ncbi:MAG: Flp family type IVb pilin [Clostridia bacterium]|nr:Flp family type IVb pilin [Clostridia bacterium]
MTEKLAVYLERYIKKRKGQGIVEYLFIVSLIALVVILSLTALGLAVSNFFTSLTNFLSAI